MSRLSLENRESEAEVLLKELEKGRPLIVFDLETTGLKKLTDRILSFSAVKVAYDGISFRELNRINQFINPEMQISQEISSINGITNEMVADKPTEDEAAGIIKNFIGENALIAGYNSKNFDEGFVDAMYQRVFGENFSYDLHIDVFPMAKELLESDKYKLSVVAEKYGLDMGLTFHQSMDDVIATTRVLQLALGVYKKRIREKELGIEQPKQFEYFKIYNARLYAPSHKVERIYVATNPKTKTYYDGYKKEWCSDSDTINLEYVRKTVLSRESVQDEKELLKKLKEKEVEKDDVIR